MSWAGDWICGACQHANFKKRGSCRRCGFSRYGTGTGQADPVIGPSCGNRNEGLAGDWYCQAMNCGAHNYASRKSCYKCGAVKLDYAAGYEGNLISGGRGCNALLPGWKSGDWLCTRPGCGVHNYAIRTECFKCGTAKEFGRC